MSKNYILDTNVLIRDPDCLFKFEDNNIIIPLICIEELDKLKMRDDLAGYNAKQVARSIYNLSKDKDLTVGVKLDNGGTLKIETNHLNGDYTLPNGYDEKKADNKLLIITKNIESQSNLETILVTQDICLTIKGKAIGLKVEDYNNDKITVDKIYKGKENIQLSYDQINEIYDSPNGIVPEELNIDSSNFSPNMFLLAENLSDSEHTTLFKYDGKRICPLEHLNDSAFGVKPRNLEQKMAFELLMDDSLPLVTISGAAGTGKTFLSMAVAMEKVVEQHKYSKIILVRPVVPAGEDIGFLPGTEEEKLKPWMGSFYDALESMFSKSEEKKNKKTGKIEKQEKPESIKAEDLISMLQEKGIIETKTFTYMRGRNLARCLVIIDEAQEMTPHLAKLMLTRAGEDARFIMIGDPSDNQIDNTLVNSKTNGFVYVIEKMKNSFLTGHIAFEKVERSLLAKEAEKLL